VTRARSKVTPLLAHAAVLAGCVVAMGSGGCGKAGSVVGGACASGYAQCGNDCVDLSTDPDNCGACGHACAMGVACAGGVCAGNAVTGGGDAEVDGLEPDAGVTAEAGADSPADVSSAGDSTVDGPSTMDSPSGSSSGGSSSGSSSSSSSSSSGSSSGSSSSGAPGIDGSQADSSANDGSGEDSTGDDGSANDGGGDDGCDPPFDTPEHCGDCVTTCSDPTPICSPTEGGPPECAAQCDVPYVACGPLCIDPVRDPYNCGVCGKVCASNLCADGVCSGEVPGEVIVIGHDYFGVSSGTPEAQVLSNAVLLPTANPLRILSFEEYADATAVSHVKSIVAAAASAEARTLQITVSTNDADIPAHLTVRNYDLLLVYDQATADAPTLSTIGGNWTSTLSNFLSVGGTVVALDGAEGLGQMPSLLSQSALLDVTSHTPVAYRSPLTVAAPNDSVARGVLSPYGALNDTVEMAADAPSASIVYVVVNAADNMPVVVHKTVR
jgi:hypothetical protein